MLVPAADAIAIAADWSSVAVLGDSAIPALAFDLRGATRRDLGADAVDAAVDALAAAPWVSLAVVDAGFDHRLAALADACDVVIGQGDTGLATAVDVDDAEAEAARLTERVQASPAAAVALVQLLRLTHRVPVDQALHAESLTYGLLQSGATFQTWLASRRTPPPAETGPAVALERSGSLLRITLNRPARRNALNVTMRDQLTEALELLDADASLDGAILAGAGPNFSAGGDLDEFGTTPSAALGHHIRAVRSVARLAHRVRDRLRVHVHGACIGAGIELPAFAHAVIAHPDAHFRLPEVGFGLVPGAGGTVSVTRRCGRHRSAWLALSDSRIDATTALRWGLVDRLDPTIGPSVPDTRPVPVGSA